MTTVPHLNGGCTNADPAGVGSLQLPFSTLPGSGLEQTLGGLTEKKNSAELDYSISM